MTLGTVSIVVLNVGGDIVAFHNRCPHQGAPIACGILTSAAVDVDEIGYECTTSVDVVRCPWHGWDFDARTGFAIADGRYRLRTYEVQIEAGMIVVHMGPRGRNVSDGNR